MRPIDKLTDEHRAELERLCGLCPDLAAIRDLARGFTDLVRTRGGDRLTTWLEQAEHSTIAEIRSFAKGLRPDWDTVRAGLTTSWNSGAVEGSVNRIKTLKRQMYAGPTPTCSADPSYSPINRPSAITETVPEPGQEDR
ncbi:ISL3 family transposase [Solwaraspora sp. WMMB762]|uniref:ISL3 family transposase n=1 Tax=Solwaraspora sp. WMMB762 TaxID=3404120 RepID=UPI003B94DBAF